jgi:UDP-glucose 4,6-dehydratase
MTRRVAKEINTVLKLKKEFSFFENEKEMYKFAAKTPRSNCLLQNKKLKDTGIKVRTSLAAIKDSLNKWEWEKNENSGIDESFWK